MEPADQLLSKIVAWADADPNIRAVILTGSLARNDGTADELSDIDIEIFANDHEAYASADGWMRQIGDVWMYLPLPGSGGYPNRLVVFDGGLKVDFSLRPLTVLSTPPLTPPRRGEGKLSALYERGYRVLLDKDGLAADLPAPAYRSPPATPPSQEEFTALVEEFWFEAYHVAKYLKRDDLWTAKARDWAIKELLLRMIEIYERALHGPDYDTWHLGHYMLNWTEPDVWAEVQDIFAHFDAADSWRALEVTMNLFRKTARRTAELLALLYPEGVDENFTGYIASLRAGDAIAFDET